MEVIEAASLVALAFAIVVIFGLVAFRVTRK
jgi:hypothetical protein